MSTRKGIQKRILNGIQSANPYKISKDLNREQVVEKYEIYIKEKIEKGEVNLEELRGKTLGCWCKPEACHGDVLLRLLKK